MPEDMLKDAAGCNADGARTYYVSFRPNGSSAPTVYYGQGISAVAYVTGSIIKFTFTDDRGWLRMLNFTQGIKCAAGGAGQGFHLELDTTNTDTDNGIVAVAICNGSGTRADIASDANTMAFFSFVVSKDYGDT